MQMRFFQRKVHAVHKRCSVKAFGANCSANYQATIWRRALSSMINAPDITNHGWPVENSIVFIE